MEYLKLTVGYDGTGYHGWASQAPAHGPTVQGTMEERLKRLTGETLKLVGASRTDAGVHARGQVVALATASGIPPERWPLAAASVLPPDIVVRDATTAGPDFDPRRHAVSKTYVYTIDNAPVPDVLFRRYSYHVRAPLAVGAMRRAAPYLVGAHDFRAFTAAGGSAKTFVRTLTRCQVEQDGSWVRIYVSADGFLYHMVRIIVGTLLLVGRGKLAPEDVETILLSRRRELAGPTAPAHGLCLEEVVFSV